MGDEEVRALIDGIAVVVDDEVDDEGTNISRIVKEIESNGIPVLKYKSPDDAHITSFQSVSFAVLDWDFRAGAESEPELSEHVDVGETLGEELTILPFLEKMLSEMFIPVFIYTNQNIDTVKAAIRDSTIGSYEKIIQVKAKDELGTDDAVIKDIIGWIKDNASLFVLKAWEKQAYKGKTRMFRDLYSASPKWVSIMVETLKADSGDEWKSSFGELITRNFSNRVERDFIDISDLEAPETDNPEEMRKVIQGERYISYGMEKPKGAYCGDIIKDGDKYYLNIRAQCSLSRQENPEVYLIEGEEIKADQISSSLDMKIYVDKLSIGQKEYSYANIQADVATEINRIIEKANNCLQYSQGQILAHVGAIIEPCIADVIAIKFSFRKFKIRKFNEQKDMRIGRILTPDITRIQQSFATYIVREGIMSVPEVAIKEG